MNCATRIEFRHKRLFFVFLFLVGAIGIPLVEMHASNASNAYMAFVFVLSTNAYALVTIVLPILAVWIAGDTIVLARRSRQRIFALTRVARVRYAINKMGLAHGLTAMTFASALLLCFGLALMVFPMGTTPGSSVFPPFLHALFVHHPLPYVGIVIGLITLSAMAWSAVALLLSVWTANIYIVLGGPWLIYMATSVILQASNLTQYSPIMWAGSVVELSAGASATPIIIPITLILLIIICDTIVLLSFVKGGEVLD